ncbi:Transcription termination factor 4, mitochondrial [Bagarius yarrelli]|uniref:Transcription termination factor 4, mitochondrial n=1 Tax=Bagarius yarrelli TaxID=175774 RepID=A0A556V4U4_BAGYA|nr:Transcription termination factor 4, mitochondrial [Bagarius yarrelli]
MQSLAEMGFSESEAEMVYEAARKYRWKHDVPALTVLFSLGLNPESVLKILEKCPELYSFKEAQLQQRVVNLRKVGLIEGSLQRVISHYPQILSFQVKRVNAVSRLLREKCQFTAQQMADILRDAPRVVEEEPACLEYMFQYVYFRMGCRQADMVKAKLFRLTLEELRCRHSFLERRGLFQTPDKKGQTLISNPRLKDILNVSQEVYLTNIAKASQEEFQVETEPGHTDSNYLQNKGTKMNSSTLPDMSQKWLMVMQNEKMNFLLIPAVLLTTITLVINPFLLFCIFSSPSLRQETRYLLLANTLLSDVLFLSFNLTNISCNALDMEIHYIFCEVLMVATVTTYCSSVLTVTLMVIDTFMAVRWPLRYNEILPLSRVKKIVAFVWVIAVTYPLSLLVVKAVRKQGNPENLKVCLVLLTLVSLEKDIEVSLHIYFSVWVIFCTVLVLYCYIRLYMVTRSSGIWRSRYSRARLTLLAHSLMLLIYFAPGLVFTVELAQFQALSKYLHLAVWINTVNLAVLMVVPRACAPYLYGLRYREVYETVQLMLRKRRLSQITDSSPTPPGP